MLNAAERVREEGGLSPIILAREHMNREHPEKGVEGEQIRNLIETTARDAAGTEERT